MTGPVSQQSYEAFSYNYLPLLSSSLPLASSPSFLLTSLPSLHCVVLTYPNPALVYRHTEAGVTRELSRLITISTLLSTARFSSLSVFHTETFGRLHCFYFVNCLIISFRHFLENVHPDQDGRLSSTQEPGPPALVLEQIGQGGGSY